VAARLEAGGAAPKGQAKVATLRTQVARPILPRWNADENLSERGSQERAWGRFLVPNILAKASLSKSDDYDKIKKKIGDAVQEAAKAVTEELDVKRPWIIDSSKWREAQVFYLQVEPEGIDPFSVEGKDFTVKVEWTNFKAYSPNSDLQNHDPHYTLYEASSPAAGRKMYKMLSGDPKALKNVSWGQFSDWLKKNKISYSTHFSQWT
jgi:hypothetical protein